MGGLCGHVCRQYNNTHILAILAGSLHGGIGVGFGWNAPRPGVEDGQPRSGSGDVLDGLASHASGHGVDTLHLYMIHPLLAI